jgi:hypothetical protein
LFPGVICVPLKESYSFYASFRLSSACDPKGALELAKIAVKDATNEYNELKDDWKHAEESRKLA